jgi:hypothetical protein
MKNVQEVAFEYAEKTVDQCENISISTLKEYAQIDFQAGVSFAQKWNDSKTFFQIEIKDGYDYSEDILVKDIFNKVRVGKHTTSGIFIDMYMKKIHDVVEWRPVFFL